MGAGAIALVTGAGDGMGREHALGLARAGFHVVATDIDGGRLAALAEEAGGLALDTQVIDVCDEASVKAGVARTLDRFGRIDVLVNNAGGAVSGARLEETELDVWTRTLALNLTSQFLMIRSVLPGMRERRAGRIINIASTSVFSGITASLYRDTPPSNLVGYVAAKGGVVAMTRALARELGAQGITVNAVAPGFTPTPRVLAVFPEKAIERMVDDQAIKRAQTARDATGAVLFLASEQGGFVTGQVIRVDGGGSMG